MTTEIETAKQEAPKPIEAQIAEWSATKTELAELVKSTDGITVAGNAEGEKKGREAVHDALMKVWRRRTAIDNREEDLLKVPKQISAKIKTTAEDLRAILVPRENALRADRDAYDAKLEAERKAEEVRIAAERAEADRLAREKLQSRIDSVQALGGSVDLAYLQTAGDDEISSMLARLRTEKEERETLAAKEEAERIERERIEEVARQVREEKERVERTAREEEERVRREAAEAEAAAERQRLAAERAEMDRRQEEIAEQERAVREAREKLERETNERAEAEERRVREAREAQEKAEREAEARRVEVERLAREAEERKQAEEAAAALEAARRPDLEKLRTWSSEWLAARPELPEIADKSVEAAMLKAARDVADTLSALA